MYKDNGNLIDTNPMMNTLTKDQFQQLTSEQQETVASVELRRAQKRQQLLTQARCYRGQNLVSGVIFSFVVCLASYNAVAGSYLPSLCIFALAPLIGFHADRINRRLDALIELLDTDV